MTFALEPTATVPRRKARVELDNYPTPSWCVRRLVEAVPSMRAGGHYLEPSAGSGGIIRAAITSGVDAKWTAVEIDERHKNALGALPSITSYVGFDFLEWSNEVNGLYHLALGNPPYSLALEFAQACLRVAANVCLLLRVGFLESDERNAWIRENTPDLYVLPNRPAFRHGSTDSCVYAWHWWGARGRKQGEGRVRVLASTPLQERKLG